MNEPMSFNNPEFGKVRAVEIDGEPWLVGKDVAQALGYSNHRKALDDHVDYEDKMQGDGVTIRDSIGREQHPTIINESGLYSLIFSSKLPDAKKFKHWVTSEVLPSIRKTGSYSMRPAPVQVVKPKMPDVSPGGLANLIWVTRRVMLDMGQSPQEIGAMTRTVLNTWGVPITNECLPSKFISLNFEDFF